MLGISPIALEYVLSGISNGFIFEDFCKDLLAKLIGYTFIPVGGVHDKGIDGLESTFTNDGHQAHVYQTSIEKGSRAKIRKTLRVLQQNEIECKRFTYLTNVTVSDEYKLVEELYAEFGVAVQIFDIEWFKVHINDSPQTVDVFRRFQDQYVHEYARPDKAYELIDVKDPTIFVYLRQQWDESQQKSNLDEVLADTLILYALEGTDPDKGILRTKFEILARIGEFAEFDINWLRQIIDRRLAVLSKKPLRKIKHHRKVNAYTLPYETRVAIEQRNIEDKALYEEFRNSTLILIQAELTAYNIALKEPYLLVHNTFHRVFREQGLEFAQFIASGDSTQAVDKNLSKIVSGVVADSEVPPIKRPEAADALLKAIRAIIYRGTEAQSEFLRRLSNTYRMLFLLQCDPKLASFFAVMAGKLQIYVDNSILIPALSELFLAQQNRRYWNLLTLARSAGVRLISNDIIIRELAAHLRLLKRLYKIKYESAERIYLDEASVIYVDEPIIRAYFYAKMQKRVDTFDQFFEEFVTWDMEHAEEELVEWLKQAFGIEYENRKSLNLELDSDELDELYEELKKYKNSDEQARNDAIQVLSIYALREKNNELGEGGIFGYRTWWLTTDTITQRCVDTVSERNHNRHSSPYMRSDFLYNYISLAPTKTEVDKAYQKIFPTLVGVNISYHIPSAMTGAIQQLIKEHSETIDKPKFIGQLRTLTQRLQTEGEHHAKETFHLWLDEQKKRIVP